MLPRHALRLSQGDAMTKADELNALADRCRVEMGADACWPWRTGKKGSIWINGLKYLVSRVMLERKLQRTIRPGLLACHTCDNPPCFNPAHLYEGTHADNMRDMKERQRYFAATQPTRFLECITAAGKKTDWTKGEGNPKAVLSSAEIARIRSSAVPTKDLARLYGIHRTTIQRIRSGKRWRNA